VGGTFSEERESVTDEESVSLTKRDQNGQQQAKLKKTLQKIVKFCVKIVG
jgi:hypothetical protein